MSKRTVIISHGHPNNQSWIEREFKRANMGETGGSVIGDRLIADYTPTLIIMNNTSAMGKSEQRISTLL